MAALKRGVSGDADVSEPSKDGMKKTIDKTRARFAETAKELRSLFPLRKNQIIRWRLSDWEEMARTDGFSPDSNSEMPLELH